MDKEELEKLPEKELYEFLDKLPKLEFREHVNVLSIPKRYKYLDRLTAKDLYNTFPDLTQIYVDEEAEKIKRGFYLWVFRMFYSSLAIILIYYFGGTLDIEPKNKWFQRIGSLITLGTVFWEVLFYELEKQLNPANHNNLYPTIYIKKRYRPLLIISKVVSLIIIAFGTIIWGYGDLIFKYFLQ